MVMTKSRRAGGTRASKPPVQSSVEVVTKLASADGFEAIMLLASNTDETDLSDLLARYRKFISNTFQGYCDIQSGGKGDINVAYTQKMHWSFLDLFAMLQVELAACSKAVRHLAAVVEAERKAAAATRSAGIDGLSVEPIDERRVRLMVGKGANSASCELNIPAIIDRGAWSELASYSRGDAVSFHGSLWIAQKDQPGKPDAADSGWRLAVKRGRDGKDMRP